MSGVEAVDAVPGRPLESYPVYDAGVFQRPEKTLELGVGESGVHFELSKVADRMAEECLDDNLGFRAEEVPPCTSWIRVRMAHLIPLIKSSFAGRYWRVR